ncbi:MAG: PTS sugar transporter subunit IIA [Holdemania massiliensis]
MALADILDENIIDLHLKSTTKDEVLHDLSQHLFEAGYIEDIEQFVKDIYIREAEGITGMGKHIIPRPAKAMREENRDGSAAVRMKLNGKSYDDEPINLIFLFCVSDDADFASNHMMLLAELAGKLGNDERVEKLQKVSTKQELIDLFLN